MKRSRRFLKDILMGFAVLAILETITGLYILGISRFVYTPGLYLSLAKFYGHNIDGYFLFWTTTLSLPAGFWMRFRIARWDFLKTLVVGALFILMDLVVIFVSFLNITTRYVSREKLEEMGTRGIMYWFWDREFQYLVFPLVVFFVVLAVGNLIAWFLTRYHLTVTPKNV